MFIVKIMKYPIYKSLSYNSPDFQYKADFGSGDFQYTCPRLLVLLANREHAHDMLLVSVLVSEVELKLSIISLSRCCEGDSLISSLWRDMHALDQ
jgi:hypothetical protein